MYNGKTENKKAMLSYMCKAIMEMRANGSKEYNHICDLKLIKLENDVKRWWGEQRKGEYVRIVWSDSPDRDDGYYDVYIEGDSALGVFEDVWKFVSRKL